MNIDHRSALRLLAATAACAAATLYLAQPILALVAKSFGLPAIQGGIMVSSTQAGYAVGLLLVLPLSDAVRRRQLMLALLGALAAALALVALSSTFSMLLATSFAVGFFASVAQLAVPLAASFSAGSGEAASIAIVFGGLLTGILGSRTLSGFIGQALGWRALYGIFAPIVAVLAIWLHRSLPPLPTQTLLRYRDALRSMARILIGTPGLLWGLTTAGCLGLAFGAFWTSLTFRLEAAPWHLHPAVIGLFGLLGVAGVLGAPRAGRFIDRLGPGIVVTVAIGIAVVGQALIGLAGGSLLPLALGIFIYDLGHQVAFVSNMVRVQALVPGARFRLNALLMTTVFVGMAVGSLVGTFLWPSGRVQGEALLLFAALLVGSLANRVAMATVAAATSS